jgi:hypothetical protein
VDIDFPSVGQLLAAVPVLALAIALANVWVSTRNERRRTQPVVIAHARGHVLFVASVECWVARAVLKNEGGGPAFNVIFGVELAGVRFPYRMDRDDIRPSRQRVVAPGDTLPQPDSRRGSSMFGPPDFSIFISSLDFMGLGRTSDEEAIYWCRYENAHGQTWETHNPGDRSGELEIIRVCWHPLDVIRRKRAARRLNRRKREIERTVERETQAADLTASGSPQQGNP